MLNYLRMELRRLRTQKHPGIILLVVILIFGCYSIFFNYAYHELQNELNRQGLSQARDQSQDQNQHQGLNDSANGGLAAETPLAKPSTHSTEDNFSMSIAYDTSMPDTTGEELFLEQYSGHSFVIFLVIFAAIFFTAPYHHGYVKNFISLQKLRFPFILAEAVTGAFYTLLVFIIGTTTLLLFQQFYIAPEFRIADFSMLLPLIGLHLLLHIAFLMVLLLLATWTQSQITVLTAGLLWTTVFHRPILDLLSTGLKRFLPLNDAFTLRDYSLITSMSRLTWGASDAEIRRSLILATIIGLLALLASMVIIERKDID